MDKLDLNLSENEFSTGRKVLLWISATLFLGIGLWDVYLKNFKNDVSVNTSLTIVLFSISAFIYLIALLATLKRKEHYFRVDDEIISYRFGLIFPKHHEYKWSDISKIRIPKEEKKLIIILKDNKEIHINLNWVEKNNGRIIRRHVYYCAKSINLPLLR